MTSTTDGRTVNVAKITWDTLSSCNIEATPERYQVLYTYFSGKSPELGFQLDPYIKTELTLTADLLDYASEFHKGIDDKTKLITQRADEISQTAQRLVDDVSASRGPLEAYGVALDHWATSLTDRTTVQELLKAVAALGRETSQASQRNRTLERQLTTSASQISKLRQELIDVKQEAKTCSLTGIANRKAFDAGLRRAVTQARSDQSPLCLLMLDVDHFKRFNDKHGHRTGDHVLRLVARLLSDNIKGKDTVARYGGEEFAILLAGASLEAGVKVAGQICERIGSQRLVKRGTGEAVGQITMSIGVAQLQDGEGTVSFVERADAALYEAKRTGRNRVCAA